MRYRDYKQFAPGQYYHVFNRGNGKMDIFRDEQDYENFLIRLYTTLGSTRSTRVPLDRAEVMKLRFTPMPTNAFTVIAYCLMPNHFHLQVGQAGDIPVSKLIAKVCTSYSMYFNRKYDHVGHVFQDQFKAVPVVNDSQMLTLSAYIHQNPKVAGLVNKILDWPYSSYREYTTAKPEVCDITVLSEMYGNSEIIHFTESRYDEIVARKDMQALAMD